ncbi:type II toxin-antitoxin system HicB family antitoxin [uncultured Capnocytophaga sp.]|uniref:type II toxin-antitoxin system HicB family antitoxin n=1 Tax=uncultured Capnocytophaga sp. TaxID=159273 RepID=UPI002637F4D2|nr:type II toxin-antitoxin system HicB family antitoxin [uncultured Capnocytophaga sp.]
MKQIKIIIEKSEDFFWAYAVGLEGVTAGGETVQEAKKEIEESIAIQKELGNIPNVDYQLTYKYDTESLLQYYKGLLSNPAFERLTGINQKLIHQYAVGLKKPREAQRKKLQEGLHKLGAELLSIEL